MPIRVFVVSPTKFFRESLAHRLAGDDRCVVVGTAATADAALEAARGAASADVVLVDGADDLRRLAAALPGTPLVGLGVPEGPAGSVPRDASVAELLDTIADVAPTGGRFRRQADRPGDSTTSLTRSEAEILGFADDD